MHEPLSMLHELIGLLRLKLVNELMQLVVIVHDGHGKSVRAPTAVQLELPALRLAGGLDPAVEGGLGRAGIQCVVGAGDAGG